MFEYLIDVVPGKSTLWGVTIPIGDALCQAPVLATLPLGLFMIFSALLSTFLFDTTFSGIIVLEMFSITPIFILFTTARRKHILFISQLFLSAMSVILYGIATILTLYPLSVALVLFYPFLSLWSIDVTTQFTQLDLSFDKIVYNVLSAQLNPIINKFLGINPEEISAREWTMKNIEDVTILATQIARSSNNIDRSLAALAFFKYRSKHSLLYGLSQNQFLDYIFDIFNGIEAPQCEVSDEVMVAQSFEMYATNIDSFTKFWASFRNSELAKRLVKMSTYLLVSGATAYCGLTFDRLGYTRFEAASLKKRYSLKSADFLTTILETFNFFLNKGYAIYKGAPIDSLMDPLSSYEDWMVESRWLEQKRNFVSNSKAAGFSEFEFRMRLDRAIDQGDTILKFVKRIKSDDKQIIEVKLARLKQMRDEMLTIDDAAAMKDPPFGILLSSPPNRGKTSIVSILFNHFGKVCKLETGPGYIYTRNGVSDFWDGFKTRMWCLFLDDISFRKVDVCKSGGDPSTMEIINAINPAPYVPNQAALEDKGKTPLKCKLVIGTTNTKFLNANQYFTTPSAVMRRFRYIIEVEVKPQYANPDSSLDYSKTPPVEGYPDLWIYHVEKPVLGVNPNKPSVQTIGTFPDRKSFLQWYTGVIQKYEDEVQTLKASNQAMDSVEYCDSCILPKVDCRCNPMVAQTKLSSTKSHFKRIQSLRFPEFLRGVMSPLKSESSVLAAESDKHFRNAIKAANRLHAKAQRHVTRPRLIITLATIIVALIATWKMSQSMIAQVGRAPKPHGSEKENVWYAADYDLQTFDSTLDSQSIRLSDIESLMKRAVYVGFVNKDGKDYIQKWLKIKGCFFVTTNHGVPPGDFKLTLKSNVDLNSCNPNFSTTISESQIFRNIDRDLAVVYIPHAVPGKDLTKYMLPHGDNFDSRGEGTLFSRKENGEFISVKVSQTMRDRVTKYTHSDNLFTVDGWTYMLHKSPAYGLCGAPLVLHSPRGFVLAGLHSAAYHLAEFEFDKDGLFQSTAQMLTKSWVDIAISHFSQNFPYAEPSEPMMSANSRKVDLLPLHYKSPVRFFQEGELSVYGSLSTGRSRLKSNVEEHLLVDKIAAKLGWPIEFYKPVMTGWEPWRHALVNFTKKKGKFRFDILKMAADSYLKDIKRLVPQSEIDLLHPYDTFTAINGAAGVGYVDSIKRSTSAGHPYNRSKRYYLEPDEATEQAPEPVKPNAEVLDRMDVMREKMKKRQMVHPIFRAHLKDEPVSLKKLQAKKTRVFMGAPMDWSILVREYLLCFVRLVQRNKGAFEAMPGLVCQSKEWQNLFAHLTRHGRSRMADGDYAAFDQGVDPDVASTAWYIILTIMGWSDDFKIEENMNALHSISMDMLNVLVDFNGDLIQLNGATPSGFPLTVILNCVINSLYMRYSFIVLREMFERTSHCDDFRQYVSLACYGDDNIFGSSKDWFDTYHISLVLAEVGMTYTTADKSEPKPGFKDISQCGFLKRTWRYDIDLDAFVAPLEEKSIRKMLTIWTKSKTVTPQVQAAATVFTAVCEYFWYGREKFEEMRAILAQILEEAELAPYLPAPLPTWENLKDDFVERSADCLPLFRR